MTYIPIQTANELYVCSSSCKVTRHRVWNVDLFAFCNAVYALTQAVGDAASDPFWLETLRKIKRYRFDLSSAPLDIGWNAEDLHRTLVTDMPVCKTLYPDLAMSLAQVTATLRTLAENESNPLLAELIDIVEGTNSASIALLIKAERLRAPTEAILRQTPELVNIEVINEFQVRSPRSFHTLVVIGPGRWFPEYLLDAPRAKHIHLVHYRWIPDSQHRGRSFATPLSNTRLPVNRISLIDRAAPEVELSYAEDPLPVMNLGQVIEVARSTNREPEDSCVEAIPVFLSESKAVFVEAVPDAKVLVIDFETGSMDSEADDAQQSYVRRIKVADLQPGFFLLLRTSGGGDYIVPIADKILGESARQLRDNQEVWKAKLRDNVRRRGAYAVAYDLLELGSEIANEMNVRNWMSSRTLRTQNYTDFYAIMCLTRLDADALFYWESAQKLASAHQRAGRHIRQLLLAEVAKTDPALLQKKGTLSFDLEGASLTAFRVEQIGHEKVSVPEWRIGQPFGWE